ncbi:hypothetical protein JL722_5223 [Aureococcus anophagefferens]|nr:hypothetical protein JL722_5223 [Aureococcus anophagefferens]KAH8082514.1 hypothetical protein JL720_8541 [Aureococcus anophagefferens]
MVQKLGGKRGRPAKSPQKGPWRPTPPDGKSLKDVAGTVEDLKRCCDLVHDELKATVVAKHCWDERKRYVSRDKIEHWTKKHKGAARGGTPWKDLHATPTRGPMQKMGVDEDVLLCAVVLATMRGFGFTRAAVLSAGQRIARGLQLMRKGQLGPKFYASRPPLSRRPASARTAASTTSRAFGIPSST